MFFQGSGHFFFTPSIAIGGFVGGAFGLGVCTLFPDVFSPVIIPVFVVSGMIALFGSISHAPIAVGIMILEMTRSPVIALPAAISLITACLLVRKHTIFSEQREKKGVMQSEQNH